MVKDDAVIDGRWGIDTWEIHWNLYALRMI